MFCSHSQGRLAGSAKWIRRSGEPRFLAANGWDDGAG
jgi:hypothetical protein